MLRVAFLLFSFTVICAKSDSLTTVQNHDLITKVTVSLNNVLSYILENYESINIDGIFGVVFVQAHLNSLKLKSINELPELRNIAMLLDKTEEILEVSIPLLSTISPKHEFFFKEMLKSSQWEREIDFSKNLSTTNKYKLHDSDNFNAFLTYLAENSAIDATTSDQCLMELLASSSTSGMSENYPHNCSISDFCRFLMIDNRKIDPGYGITHRLLYLQVARSKNCLMSEQFIDSLINSFCSYILWEAKTNQQLRFPKTLDDLFLEQVTLCGYEGFSEFLSLAFIEHILSIQTEYGCFTVIVDENYQQIQKREANFIKFGCNDHTTGLGASTLALILRYFLEK